MRVWLDPQKMAFRNLTARDVVTRDRRSRTSRSPPGRSASRRSPNGQAFQYTITTLGRLTDAEQFADMILKTDAAGRRGPPPRRRPHRAGRPGLRPGLHARRPALRGPVGLPAARLQRPGHRRAGPRARWRSCKERFPEGVDYAIVYDTTPFINESVNEVFNTLRDAVILVAVVVLLFLQNWRSAIIPLVAVPVAIVGTFAVMAALGFSLNNLTLFGLVLAIGIVVDDAIVVVEAVEHHIEHGLAPREATIKAMEQVSAPVIAVGLVLTAVFVPCAFITGITGQFFRQFALTIAVSTVISAFNSLTLSPALSALLLKPRQQGRLPGAAVAGVRGGRRLGGLCPAAARTLAGGRPSACTSTHPGIVDARAGREAGRAGRRRRRPAGWSAACSIACSAGPSSCSTRASTRPRRSTPGSSAACCGSACWCCCSTAGCWPDLLGLHPDPDRLHPPQDKGYLLVNVQLPDSSSLERTQEVMSRRRGDRRQDCRASRTPWRSPASRS